MVDEFASDFIFPMTRANAVYESQYLLGTSIARPLIAKAQIDMAREFQADTVAHGAFVEMTNAGLNLPFQHWLLN